MILYDNRNLLEVFFSVGGSVLFRPRTLVPPMLSTLMLCVLLLYPEEADTWCIVSSSVFRIYGTIMGFVIVVRTNMAFGRFFSGVTHIQELFSKWRDAFTSLMVFIEASVEKHMQTGNLEVIAELSEAKARWLHWFSLMTAMAVMRLQEGMDWGAEVADGETERRASAYRNVDMIQLFGIDVRREAADRCSKPRAPAYGSSDSSDNINGRRQYLSANQMFYRRYSCVSAAMMSSQSAINRDSVTEGGLGLPRTLDPVSELPSLRQRSAATDGGSSDCNEPCESQAAFSSAKSRKRDGAFLARAPSLWTDDSARVRVLGDTTPEEVRQLCRVTDRVLAVAKWIQLDVSIMSINKKLLIAPPIMTRVYQEISNGMLAFFMAQRIADVPFPFPFAQCLQWALLWFFIFCPFATVDSIEVQGRFPSLDRSWGCLPFNFITCLVFAALNEIAIELEDPFGEDDNDYPVHLQQWQIVYAMEDCYFQRLPSDFNKKPFGADPSLYKREANRKVMQYVAKQERKSHKVPEPLRKSAQLPDQAVGKASAAPQTLPKQQSPSPRLQGPLSESPRTPVSSPPMSPRASSPLPARQKTIEPVSTDTLTKESGRLKDLVAAAMIVQNQETEAWNTEFARLEDHCERALRLFVASAVDAGEPPGQTKESAAVPMASVESVASFRGEQAAVGGEQVDLEMDDDHGGSAHYGNSVDLDGAAADLINVYREGRASSAGAQNMQEEQEAATPNMMGSETLNQALKLMALDSSDDDVLDELLRLDSASNHLLTKCMGEVGARRRRHSV